MSLKNSPHAKREYVSAATTEPLTRDEELSLAIAWKERADVSARDRLARSHLRYVIAMASKFRRYGIPHNELVAEGNVGLVHALTKFDPERGFRFITYASYWIRAYILNYVIRSWSLVGSGSGALRSTMFFRLRREKAQLASQLGDTEEAERQLAKKMNVSPEKLTSMLRQLEVRDVSLNQTTFQGSTTTLLDSLVSDAPSQEQELERGQTNGALKKVVGDALQRLDARERYIVESRLMADQEERLSLADIGRSLGVSRERARQLEARAKDKLKRVLTRTPNLVPPELLPSMGVTQAA